MIIFYQKVISPRKGYRCAYRAHTGSASCSTFGYRAIERHGIGIGFALLQRRFKKCSLEHHKVSSDWPKRKNLRVRRRAQSGYCDLPTFDCDFADSFPSADACDVADCATGPCDFDFCRRKKPQGKGSVATDPDA
jgi:uncharacterized protein